MARTAPTVDGTPSFKRVSISWVDFTGDVRSDSAVIDAATTDAQIEAIAVAMGANSSASLWKVEVSEVYEGDASKTNANPTAARNSVYDAVVGLLRNTTTRKTQNVFMVAPIPTMFSPEETDNPDTSPTGDVANVMSAWETALGAAAWVPVSARYTERREINTRQKF